MNLDQLVRAIQEELGVNVDGNAGPETWIAIYNRIRPNQSTSPALSEKVDDRSSQNHDQGN